MAWQSSNVAGMPTASIAVSTPLLFGKFFYFFCCILFVIIDDVWRQIFLQHQAGCHQGQS